MKLITILRWLGLKPCGRAVCAWCQKDLGRRVLLAPDQVSHGICAPCNVKFSAEVDASVIKQSAILRPTAEEPVKEPATPRRKKHQHRSRRTLRRTIGGWSGAVAA